MMTAYVLNEHISGIALRMPEHTNNTGHYSSVRVKVTLLSRVCPKRRINNIELNREYEINKLNKR